nr:exocyst complex component EXO70B1-like [Lolium perenne]
MSAFAEAYTSARNISGLTGVIDDTARQLKDLLLRKSELCSDPSLRYLFLLNNSNFVEQLEETRLPPHYWKLTPECEKYMYTYLDVSWGNVLFCIPRSHFPARLPRCRWISTYKLAKFELEFNKTYRAQKFWKVPDPQLRDVLRRAIADRVVSGHRDYLKEHPELAEDVYRRNSTPED